MYKFNCTHKHKSHLQYSVCASARSNPQGVVDMGMSNNNDLTLAQASFQLSPQAQQNAKAKMLKSGSSIVCSSRTP
jgi:hypothetical protein